MNQDRAMVTVQLDETEVRQVRRMLAALPVSRRSPAYLRAMQFATAEVEARLRENLAGPILRRRTGHLSRSVGSMIVTENNNISATIGSGVRTGQRVVYANILETGGVIRPKNARYLTIPLRAAMTGSGVVRRRARDWPNTFIENGIIYQRRGENAVPLFVLRRSVRIPPFRYMARTVTETQNVVIRSVQAAIDEIEDNNGN